MASPKKLREPNNHTLRRYYKPLSMVLAFTLVAFIGWIRYLTGPEFAFSFLFLLPIVTVTWLFGKRSGIALSLASAVSWLLADLSMIERFSDVYVPLINEMLRLSVFLFIVCLIAQSKKNLQTQMELAGMDPLTGVANRRAFLRLAQSEINRSRRYHHPFSVMVIDLDNFKQINDDFGHLAGDRLLRAVAETLQHHVRTIDIVARFGGDEFVVLLVRSDDRSAALVARKLQKQLKGIMDKNHWRVTFSIGLATYLLPPKSIEETIQAADALMYDVKNNGKNDIRHAVIDHPEKETDPLMPPSGKRGARSDEEK